MALTDQIQDRGERLRPHLNGGTYCCFKESVKAHWPLSGKILSLEMD